MVPSTISILSLRYRSLDRGVSGSSSRMSSIVFTDEIADSVNWTLFNSHAFHLAHETRLMARQS